VVLVEPGTHLRYFLRYFGRYHDPPIARRTHYGPAPGRKDFNGPEMGEIVLRSTLCPRLCPCMTPGAGAQDRAFRRPVSPGATPRFDPGTLAAPQDR
jgi:hypothetical protein